ncbi:PPA1309 family protein [Gordonia sp. SL306]|uniref:PPA1309 family protein n=1 Tax=Gordonia sp. SL306 TaxID=2995145 RepID=UPI0022704400|nr:PPA1309 family protein [Gordonia sp. SL306]WAC56293.1 PPA1309 family protein [Gordonia sp. SL306]
MTDQPSPSSGGLSPDALGRALSDIVTFVDESGWDQPPALFALVPTATLAQTQPDLIDPDDDSELSPIAQEPLPIGSEPSGTADLERILATTTWPAPVTGAALVQEILVLPPEAEADLDSAFLQVPGDPDDPTGGDAVLRASADAHPGARPARLAVGALRNGRTLALMQLRPEKDAEPTGIELLTHHDLATDLRAALANTLDHGPDS